MKINFKDLPLGRKITVVLGAIGVSVAIGYLMLPVLAGSAQAGREYQDSQVPVTAQAIKIVELLREHPEEWSDQITSINNDKRGIVIDFGQRQEFNDSYDGHTLSVSVDAVRLPGFEPVKVNVFLAGLVDKPNPSQKLIYDELVKRYANVNIDAQIDRQQRESDAISKLLREPQ